ncbi:hypothetical protein GH5_04256 [Leishmania sp. Ghana 2012 LV757]|uniref:hypothetical protein n=1 Tax=Leishmania sp. Ghana 2012 LV757 TaxID=2803181 RepID=UPI001B6559EA|nr:hypothetical protein GH5_04256 [Leishmania sp. Ghana 2012 LV757]
MSIAGRVHYASSPYSPISVSSSSPLTSSLSTSPSRLVESAGKKSGSGCIPREGEAAPPRARSPRLHARSSGRWLRQSIHDRHHRLLAYVAPSTTRQFVSLSSLQAYFLRHRSASCGHPSDASGIAEAEAFTDLSALRGGHWCIAYEVDASWQEAAPPQGNLEAASQQCYPKPWCFTLEPLPAEQRAMCCAALRACTCDAFGAVAIDGTPPGQCSDASSRPMMCQGWPLHDILVTPLYVCVNPAAVVPLDTSAGLRLTHRTAREGESAGAAELDALLRESPTCGTLVYALLKQQGRRSRRDKVAPPLSILDSNIWPFAEKGDCTEHREALAADVYVSVVSPSPLREEGEDDIIDCYSGWWTATLSQHLLHRWARLSSQTVLCCGERQAALRHRKGLLLRHTSDIQSDTRAALVAHNDVYTRRLSAALYLLDALRPAGTVSGRQIGDGGEASASVVVDALDVYLEECEGDGAHRQPPEAHRRYRFLRGRVRRVAAFAPVATLTSVADAPRLTPEPDYPELPWCAAHSAALAASAAQATASSPFAPSNAPTSGPATAPPPRSPPVSLSGLDACMSTLEFTPEQQTCLHDLAYSVAYLTSLKFTVRGGSSAGPAEVSATSLPALSAAAQLLRLPTSELVTVLTTVEAREDGKSALPATRRALNCAGATQMQRVLVAHLGGLVVRALMQLINIALDADDDVGTEARTFTLAAITEDEETTAQMQHAHMAKKPEKSPEGSGGGLATWYAAYGRCRVATDVRDRLLGVLQREVCYEGVGLEVNSWLDQLSTASTAPITTAVRLGNVAAEVREVLARVTAPSVKQIRRGAIVAAHNAAGAYGSVGTECDIPLMEELAHILEGVASRCMSVDVSAAPPLSSLAEVQQLLAEKLQALAASARHAAAMEESKASTRAAEVECTWEGAASASSRVYDGVLVLTFPSGIHPPLRLSIHRLAADIFTAARLCVMGTTVAIQRILHGVGKSCMSWIPTVIEAEDGRKSGRRIGQKLRQHVDGGHDMEESMGVPSPVCPCSVHEALKSTLTLNRSDSRLLTNMGVDAGHGDGTATPVTSEFLYVMLAIPVPAEAARWGTWLEIGDLNQQRRGSPSSYPFLEPVPPHKAPVPLSPAADVSVTRDDALAAYLRERHPMLLALFFWSRLCHCHMCPVPVFAKACAVPLLTLYARRRPPARASPQSEATSSSAAVKTREFVASESALPTVTDAASGAPACTPRLRAHAAAPDEAAAKLLKRVHHLQSQGRYRELCLLALKKVPQCGAGDAVLGVSVVFLGAAAVVAIQSCCTELRDMSARCIQEVGRGFAARRRLCFARKQQLQQCQQQLRRTAHFTDNRLVRAAAASAEMLKREDFECARDSQLAKTAQERTSVLIDSARQLSRTVSLLQQGWTETLELMEGELTGAVREVNMYEAQRRDAEDAARQEARLALRVHEEAWNEVWAPSRKFQARRQAARAEQRRSRPSHLVQREVESAAPVEEETRQAAATDRRMSRLRCAAAQSAEAALLLQVIKVNRREEAQLLAAHIRRQQVRLKRLADSRQRDYGGGDGVAVREEGQRRGQGRRNGIMETPARNAESSAEFSRLQRSEPEGLVSTRPRHSPGHGNRGALRTQTLGERRTPSMLALLSERDGLDVAGRTSIATIERTMTAVTPEHSTEWAVQRDLMALWESSRMSV